jgi:hypothetical protein
MTNAERPEADTWEQRQPAVAGDTGITTELTIEVPPEVDEADAVEQQRPVDDLDDTGDYPAGPPSSR